MVLPTGAYAPTNAQAALHTHAAFWSTVLLVTVHGRVADIWRSASFTIRARGRLRCAASQDLLRLRGRPLSDRIRVLAAHRGPSPPRRAHPRGSKRWWSRWLEDVLCVQRWLAALLDVGYEIPPIGATEAPAAAATGPADDVALQPCRSVIPAASAAAPQPAHGAAAARQPSTRAGDLIVMGSSLCAVRGLPGEVEPG